MAVFVDSARNPYQRMIMCHMVADNLWELFDMAQRVGMRANWFQPVSFPHFDLSVTRRTRAIELGAQVIDRRELARFMKSYRLRLRSDPAELTLLRQLARSPSFHGAALGRPGHR